VYKKEKYGYQKKDKYDKSEIGFVFLSPVPVSVIFDPAIP